MWQAASRCLPSASSRPRCLPAAPHGSTRSARCELSEARVGAPREAPLQQILMPPVTDAGVVEFYDTHPINEHEILNKLAAKGIPLEGLTENELKEFDQDHYGGF